MECPKCGGGAFLSEEELIKILEGTEPLQILIKNIYQCRACAERFSRLVSDNLSSRKIDTASGMLTDIQSLTSSATEKRDSTEVVEGIKFF
jgi:hypothetical protein